MDAEEGAVISIRSQEDFDAQVQKSKEAGKLMVVYFTASWCGPCRFMAPIFAEMAKKFPGAVHLKVDVDEQKPISEKYKVEAMPTFVFIKGGEEIDRLIGAKKDELMQKTSYYMGSASA